MLRAVVYLMCVLLAYKGFEIFQRGFYNRKDNTLMFTLGITALVVALLIAGLFAIINFTGELEMYRNDLFKMK